MGQGRIKCIVRNKWVAMTPEELVRQGVLTFLIDQLHYPKGRFVVEKVVKVNGMNKRADAIIHDTEGRPQMVIECKRKDSPLDQRTVAQIAMYNRSLDAPYLLLTNGEDAHILHISMESDSISTLRTIPNYEELMNHAV
ncbi:MAG: type I restriction enzyme HsdR N-terminal domain-containing protein [Flavobacteriales bacterium]|nr:type I restriction enzyme HsdR N-terminal domain-containing protein [Flavobacteriales bacterium]